MRKASPHTCRADGRPRTLRKRWFVLRNGWAMPLNPVISALACALVPALALAAPVS